jgi:hypothetical protein
LLAAAVSIGFGAIATAQRSSLDYPQWRGLNRDGAASAFSEPKSWPDNLTRRFDNPAQLESASAARICSGGLRGYLARRRDARYLMCR